MQWNFGEIIIYINGLISPGGGSSSTTRTTTIKNMVNAAFNEIAMSFSIEALKAPDFFLQTVDDFDDGTIAMLEGKNTGTLTDAPNYEMFGRKIRINAEGDYYLVKDVNVATKLITFDRPYLGDDDATATLTIFENLYNLPYDLAWVKSVYNFDGDWQPLEEENWDEIESWDPNLDDTGTVDKFAQVGERRLREPITGTVATTAGTTASLVYSTNFLLDDDDYYNDWIWVNTTRGKTSRIVDFVGATQYATLEEDITGQVAGDTGYLVSQRPQITFYRRPTAAKNVKVKYFKKHPILINNYDIPIIPDGFLQYIAFSVLEKYYGKDPLATKYSQLKMGQEVFLKSRYSKKPSKRQKEGRRSIGGKLITIAVQEQ